MSSITKSIAQTSSKAVKNGGDSSLPEQVDTFFFPRLSYKESSISSTPNTGDGSFRVLYYGGAGSVPFTWESRPGTPKHAFDYRPREPTLAPPPSYQLGPRANHPWRNKHHHPKSSKICQSIFSRNSASKKNYVVPTFSSSSLRSSSSYSLLSPPPKARSPSRPGLGRDEPETEPSSPPPTLCFYPISNGNSRMFRDYYDPIKNVKKMVLSIVGHAKNNR